MATEAGSKFEIKPAILDIAAASHLGHTRRRNEDRCFNAPAHGLSVVADGVGGQGDGAWASQRVVDLFCDRIIGLDGSRAGKEFREAAILDGLQFAHGQMRTENSAGGDKPSGTTIAGIWAPDGAAGLVTAFNVGDSPVFHFTKGRMFKVSKDHSVYQLWLDGGRVGKEPGKRMIVQAAGISEQVSPHIVSFPVQSGDAVLICTDGLSGTVEAAQMAKLLAGAKNAQDACDLLLAEALAGAARDNVTVSVCYF
jgi:serine/threonine protein phosphatase PrpC